MGGQGGGWKGMGKRQRTEGGAAEEMVLHSSPEPSVPPVVAQQQGYGAGSHPKRSVT